MESANLPQDLEVPDVEALDSPKEQFEIFISYSHIDEREKKKLLTHLGALKMEGLCDYWVDDEIRAGEVWAPEINDSLARARMAILLITSNYLTSDFIRRNELPKIFERTQTGMSVFPILAQPCVWNQVKWLSWRQLRPRHGNPIWRDNGTHVDEDLAAIAEEIAKIIKGEVPAPLPPLLPLHQTPPEKFPSKRQLITGGLILLVLIGAFLIWIINRSSGNRSSGSKNENTTATTTATPKSAFKQWNTNFYGLNDRPDKNDWDAPEAWKLEPTGSDKNVRALIVTGTEPGLIKFNDVEPPANCTVSIQFIVASGQHSASWLLRAQQDKQNYYLFTLTFPTNNENAAITGSLYSRGKNVKSLIKKGPEPLPYSQPFVEGDHLTINVKITGGEFSHTFILTSAEIIKASVEKRDPNVSLVNALHGKPILFSFIDQPVHYPSGSIGFKVAEQGDKLIIKTLDIEAL
jgi:hypothetical protein